MNKLFQKILNTDFTTEVADKMNPYLIFVGIIGTAFIYVSFETGSYEAFQHLDVFNNWQKFLSLSFENGIREALPAIWLRLFILLIAFRIGIIILSSFKTKQAIGLQSMNRNFITYSFSVILGLVGSLALFSSVFLLINFILRVLEISLVLNEETISIFFKQLSITLPSVLPGIFKVQNYWLALFLTIFLSGLPGYFIHWLCHRSRFFWYVSHRAHHAPNYLHPVSAPDAFIFVLPLTIIRLALSVLISTLIYTEPLVMEMTIWATLQHFVEIFNHSAVLYNFSYHNFIVRNLCRISGEFGVYHIMHHSAKPEDHTINLSGTPFLFWDRIFGTYRKPYKELPPLGLSNQPETYMNPVRVSFGGIMQLWYEWKYNKDWNTRYKIIFGSIWYHPPFSKDFLVKSPSTNA